MQKLTQLERLDLGSNEFTEVVSICHVEAVSPFRQCPHLTHPFWAFYLFFFCILILKVAFFTRLRYISQLLTFILFMNFAVHSVT